MKHLLLCLALLLTHAAYAQHGDLEPSFRELNFGDSLPELPDARFLYALRDSSKVYARADENLVVNGAQVKSIKYLFYNGVFYAVTIEIPTVKGAMIILSKLRTAYGSSEPMTMSGGFNNHYLWRTGAVGLTLDVHPTKGTATLRKEDLEMVRHVYDVNSQRKQYEARQRAGEASDDL